MPKYGAAIGPKPPITAEWKRHSGVDFGARRGDQVLAAASGTVRIARRRGAYGKLVEIEHAGGVTTRYAHLSRIRVRVGQHVEEGETLGKVGSTGRSTAPHLHCEGRVNNKPSDPKRFLRVGRRSTGRRVEGAAPKKSQRHDRSSRV